MGRERLSECLSSWMTVARRVFPNVRRDELEDVAARAWCIWLMRGEKERAADARCESLAARQCVVDAARAEWGRDFGRVKQRARTVAFADRVTRDADHADTEELAISLAARGVGARACRVAVLLTRGFTQLEIASQLGFSPATINKDVERLRARLAPHINFETWSQDQRPT